MKLKLAQNETFDPTNRGFAVRMRDADKSADVWIYDEIGSGWLGGLSAKDFADTINSLGKVNTINVFVNSPGGSVFDGQAMYATLKRHPARINMHIDGIAASIASLVVMAGDEINISAGGMMMIHAPWTVVAGNAEGLRETADTLDKIDSQLVDIYASRTGGEPAQISEWMAAETWMTADEAIENGFADAKSEELKMAACAFDLGRFKHPPEVNRMAALLAEPEPSLRDKTANHRLDLYKIDGMAPR